MSKAGHAKAGLGTEQIRMGMVFIAKEEATADAQVDRNESRPPEYELDDTRIMRDGKSCSK